MTTPREKLTAYRRRLAARKQTAKEAYQERLKDVGCLLDMLREEAWHHAEDATKEGVHWGHVGDLDYLREGLVKHLTTLAQQDDAFVEKRLADKRSERR